MVDNHQEKVVELLLTECPQANPKQRRWQLSQRDESAWTVAGHPKLKVALTLKG